MLEVNIDNYLSSLEIRGLSEATIEAYSIDLNQWAQLVEEDCVDWTSPEESHIYSTSSQVKVNDPKDHES